MSVVVAESAPDARREIVDADAAFGTAPADLRVRLDTTKGAIVIEVHRDWAPHGADRFFNLVEAGFSKMDLHGGALVLLGASAALPHGTVKPQKLKEGDVILIDAGPLVALVNRSDAWHEQCLATSKALHEPVFTV